MLSNFLYGVSAVFQGIADFYRDRSLWKYSLFPLGCVALFYILLAGAGLFAARTAVEILYSCDFPDFWQWSKVPLAGFIYIFFAGAILLITLFATGTFYELFGGVFFDKLIEHCIQSDGKNILCANSRIFELRALLDSMLYSLNTLLWMVLLFLPSVLLPVIGPLLTILLISYRLGTGYLAIAALRFGRSFARTRAAAKRNCSSVLGYGLTIYILFSLPFGVIIFLPGIMLGGVLLLQNLPELREDL